jgi:hypothetical protein
MKQSISILTPEDKKYLRKVSRYLQSYGLQRGDIDLLELEDGNEYYEISDIRFDRVTNLSNNYSVEVPEGLIPILQKIVVAGQKRQDDIDFPDYVNYGRIEIEIDCVSSEIRLFHYIVYTDAGGGGSIEYSAAEDEISMDVFNSIRENCTEVEPFMEVTYNGSGDSGYLEDRFENGEPVTGPVEDWCYRELSRNFGGWENNEGSQGNFIFNMENNTAELNHTWNEQNSITTTLFEGEFGK